MEKSKSKKLIVPKPSFFLYTIPAYIMRFWSKFYWKMQTDNSEIKNLEGPIFAIAPHASTIDILPTLCTLLPKKFNIVAAKDLFTWNKLKPFIHAFGAIPMHQNAMDIKSIKMIKTALDLGRNVVLYPEGKTSLDGKQMFYLNPSIAKFIKFLGCTVVLVKTNGAYATKPRYAKGFRRGKMETKATVLFTKEEVKSLPPKEIYARIQESFVYNDNIWQQENAVKFKAKELASNLNYILYKCPKCGAEYEMEAKGDKLKCLHCGNTVTLTPDGHLVPNEGDKSFDRIDLWMDYEKKCVFDELQADDFYIEKPVKLYHRDDKKHKFFEDGQGVLYLNKDFIGYKGTKGGEEWKAELPVANMHTLITKNSEGIDLVIDYINYRFMFDERKYSTKYMIIVESLFAMRNGIKYF